ncbi:acyltransferase [uncultured Marinobacter sp.]|uniref:acyltransferase family protein n=1 Tax=uncultured Marinobacter sp. TaxID=187379 RepID=UPI0030DB53EA
MFTRLESIRGLAACLVVIYHSPFRFENQSFAFISNSYLFVDLFFVLSGFVMAYAYSEKILAGMGFSRYLALRLGRLYPLHLFTLMLWVPYVLLKQYLYLSGFGGTDQLVDNNVSTFFSNLMLIHAMGIHDSLSWNQPSWSISTEFFAYLVFFVLTVSLDRQRTLIFPLLVSAGCYLALQVLGQERLLTTYDYGFIRCLGAFYLGILVYRIRSKAVHENWLATIRKNRQALTGAELAATLLVIASVSLAGQGYVFALLAVASFCVAILVFSAPDGGALSRVLNIGLIRQIGVWSFSIYMIHRLLQFGVSNVSEFILGIDPEQPMGWVSVVINLIMLAAIIWLSKWSYEYVEKPCRDWVKRRLSKPELPPEVPDQVGSSSLTKD